MKITYESIGAVSTTEIEGLPIGKQAGVINEGIQPTFGSTAEGMGFRYFFMTVKWSRQNRMIPMSEIDDDIKSLMSGGKIQLDDWLNKSVEELSSSVNTQGGRGCDYVPQSPLSEKEPGKYQIRSLWRVLF